MKAQQSSEIGFCEIGFCKVKFCKIGFCEIRFCKTGFCKTGFCRTEFCETGFCEMGFCEMGFCETGFYSAKQELINRYLLTHFSVFARSKHTCQHWGVFHCNPYRSRHPTSVAYLRFHKGGPNFRWPLVLTQKGAKPCLFPIFSHFFKHNFCVNPYVPREP